MTVMRRVLTFAVGGLVALSGCSGSSGASPTPSHVQPTSAVAVLGSQSFDRKWGEGWGQSSPKTVGIFGDGTASLSNARWSGWGSPVAIAHGRYDVINPGPRAGHVLVPGELRAYDLGPCLGRTAYRKVEYRAAYPVGTAMYRRWGPAEHQWKPYVGHGGDVCRSTSTSD